MRIKSYLAAAADHCDLAGYNLIKAENLIDELEDRYWRAQWLISEYHDKADR